MIVAFNLGEHIVQSYLVHYNEVFGTNYTFETLTDEQRMYIAQEFGHVAKCELEMRCDDHSGFETENYFTHIFGD